MTMVTIYDAEKVDGLAITADVIHSHRLHLLNAPVEFRSHSAIVWTDKIGGGGDEPDRITINTMSRQLIFTNPRLIFFSNNLVVLSALSDRDPSGTLHHVKKFYIEMDNSCEH